MEWEARPPVSGDQPHIQHTLAKECEDKQLSTVGLNLASGMMQMVRTIGLTAVFTAIATLPLAAADLSVAYRVDVGPVTLSSIDFALELGADTIHSRAKIESQGLSRIFSEYSAEAEGESRLDASGTQPVRFQMARKRDKKRRENLLRWSDSGGLSYEPPINKPELRASVERALNGSVTDPITAVLRIGTAGDAPCPSVHQVFDGRDVFELVLTDKGRNQIDGGKVYQGPGQICEVRWTPVAGRDKERNVPGDSYDVSFAPVGKLPSGRDLWLPVEVSGTIKGLPFRAYAHKLRATH
jgi:hypothetical protein